MTPERLARVTETLHTQGMRLVNVDGGTVEVLCARGHQYKTLAARVLNGHGCRECSYEDRRYGLFRMQEAAAKHGGQCVSRRYVNCMQPLTFVCRKGHRFRLHGYGLLSGVWCKACYNDSLRLGLTAMQEMAISRGGRCLSTEYVNARTKLLWECHKGHQWQAVPDHVKNRGYWCPVCGRKQAAESRRGKGYARNRTPFTG